jgi:integrase/recombinase XerD
VDEKSNVVDALGSEQEACAVFEPKSEEGQKDKTVSDVFEEYTYVIGECSPHTQRRYVGRLTRFVEWCTQQQLLIGMIRPAHVARYLQTLREPSKTTGKLLSTYTLDGHMRDIRAFLYWCAKPLQAYVWVEVPRGLIMPRVEKVVIKPFSPEQIRALQRAVTKNPHPFIIARDKAILAVLLDTGIRANELCTLTLEHVYLTPKEAYLLVLGKGLKQREVPLGKLSRQLLEEYIQIYRPADAKTQCVFLGHNYKSLTTSGLAQAFNRWEKRAKITGVRCSPHDCRHTYAINYLMQDGDVYMLSRLMGHASVSTTEMYLRAVKAIQARTHSKSVLDHLFDDELKDREEKGVAPEASTFLGEGSKWEETQAEYEQWLLFFRAWLAREGNGWRVTSDVMSKLGDVLPPSLRQREGEHPKGFRLRVGSAFRIRGGIWYGEERLSIRSRPGKRGMTDWQVYQAGAKK